MDSTGIQALASFAQIIVSIGKWPIISVMFGLVMGPWVMMYILSRGQEKRFEAVILMYEKNVDLVKEYQTMSNNQQDVILFNTQKMTEINTKIDNNLYCPLVRKKAKQTEVET